VRRVTSAPVQLAGSSSRRPAPALTASRPAALADLELLGRHLPELSSVPAAIRLSALQGAMVVEANPGEVLLRQGEIDTHAFFILEGHVVVQREESGRFRTTRRVGPGEQFGEISALGSTPRTATAIAEGPARALRLPVDALRNLMKTAQLSKVVRSRMSERLMITDRSLMVLRAIVQISMLINVFLLMNEVFKEFYSKSKNITSSTYLFFGLEGHHALVPWIWTAVVFNLIAMFLLVLPLTRSLKYLNIACVLAIVGIWIEKGMGLVVPGFIPTPLGEIVEYSPSFNETLICLGIWAFGFLAYTVFLRMSVPILQGKLSKENENVPLAQIIFPQPVQPVSAAAQT